MQTIGSLPAAAASPWGGGLGRPRLMLATTALGLITAVAAWQWSWLVAVGIAPLLLSAAPCAAMCGLGLCVHRMGGRTCGSPRDAKPALGPIRAPSAMPET